jgi:hypothetical protein
MAGKTKSTAQPVGQNISPSSRTPITVAMIVIALLIASYWIYVRHQTSYFANRDLHLLAWSSNQLAKSVERTSGYVRSFAQWGLYAKIDWKSYRAGHDLSHKDIAERYFPGFEQLKRLDADELKKNADKVGFTQKLTVQNGAQVVAIQSIDAADWPAAGTAPTVGATGKIPLEKIADPVFQTGFLDVFDELILAKPGGEVIYRMHPADSERNTRTAQLASESGINRHDPHKGQASRLMLTDLRQLQTKALFHDAQPLTVDSLAAETHYADVTIGGEDYVFFSQPCRLFGQQEEDADAVSQKTTAPVAAQPPATASAAATSTAAKSDATAVTKPPPAKGVWIVCGLVSRSHFREDALAISSPTVALVVALLLLAVCCWPFLRIALIGEFERLTVADALAVIVGALLGLSIATLLILDVISYRRIESVTDKQLRDFSGWFEGWLRTDIDRASKALAKLEANRKNPASGTTGSLEKNLPVSKDPQDPINVFPYIESLAWIDEQGMQRAKESVGPPSPLISVADRRYFLDAKAGNLTVFGCGLELTKPVVLESIHSGTTGNPEAIFSMNVAGRHNGYSVLAMTASQIQAINPVLPPAFGFVIIDDAGNVIFHDDPQRNGNENFFDESDHNRQLRAAVLARRADSVEMKYWGEDHSAYVRPMEGLPWTLIVYRNKRLLETMNVESLVFTLFFLLLFASLLVMAIGVSMLARPRYRAPWAWPSPKKLGRYRRLIVIYVLLAAVFAICIITLHERWIVMVSLVLPLIAMISAYLVLIRGRASVATFAISAAGLALVSLFFYAVFESRINLNVRFTDPFWTKALIDAGMSAAVVLVPFRRKKQRLRPSSEIEHAYVWCGALGLLLISVLPTFGFFKAAWWLEIEALLKSGQLTIATRLEQRMEFVASKSALDVAPVSTTYFMPHFYDSSWWLLPAAAGHLTPQQRQLINETVVKSGTAQDEETTLPDVIERFLPQYSEDSVRMRDLRQNRASDDSWRWFRRGQLLFLSKNALLDHNAFTRIPGVTKSQQMLIISHYPSMMPAWLLSAVARETVVGTTIPDCPIRIPKPDDPLLNKIFRRFSYFVLALAFWLLMLWIVRFIARSIFLLDLQAPRWLFSRSKLKPTLGDHIFLTRGSKDAGKLIDVGRFSTFHFSDLKKDDDIATALITLDAGVRDVLCVDLNTTPIDGEAVIRELVFLERLMDLPNRTVIVDATVSPLLIQTMASSEKPKGARLSPRQRWENILSRFIWLTEEQLVALNKQAKAQGVATASRSLSFRLRLQWRLIKPRFRALMDLFCWTGDEKPAKELLPEWLFRETHSDAFLKKIADQVSWRKYSREETLDEIRERAESYYAGLWASCSPSEKLLLHQLAKQGLVNGKNRKSIRRLIARGLVRRGPSIRVFSETFRRYVLEVANSQRLTEMEEQSTGLWNSLRVPIALVTLTIAVIFFASQKDLLNMTTGIVTGLAAGLPAIAKLVGLITERRLDAG